MKALIDVQNLATATPDGTPLSEGLTFQLNPGELTTVTGENGAGKTTLARALLGLHRHYGGQIERRLKTDEIAYLPQMANVQFFLPLSLRDVIELKGRRRDEEIAAAGLLEPRILERPWNSSSGGERQRALLTRVFLAQARLLVLDEPFNHLDAATRLRVEQKLEQELKRGAAVLMISHADGSLQANRRLHLRRLGEQD